MIRCEQYIIEYAAEHESFHVADLLPVTDNAGYPETSVNWSLHKLSSEGKLFRTGRGIYSIRGNQLFRGVADTSLIEYASMVAEYYPMAQACFYKGTVLSPLLHHLSYNALSYIEVPRDLTEILFHHLRDAGEKVYLKPSREVVQNYIDFSQPGIIIKPLITGAPLTMESGIHVPTLEKLLVDTLCDEDFSYLRGGEWHYMLENAFSLFTVNQSRLLRYAGRRGKRLEITEAIKNLTYHDSKRMLYQRVDRVDP